MIHTNLYTTRTKLSADSKQAMVCQYAVTAKHLNNQVKQQSTQELTQLYFHNYSSLVKQTF